MADANSAYTLADADHLKQLDEFYLMMIEQPLAHDDIIDHADAAGEACKRPSVWMNAFAPRTTPSRPSACAPAASSISSSGAWADSPRPDACTMSRKPHGIPVWCGGMLEAGVGRAHNIALATLAQFRAAGRRLGQQPLLDAGHHRAAG